MNRINIRAIKELTLLTVVLLLVFILAGQFDLLERILNYSHHHEQLELDELLICGIAGLGLLLLFALRRWHEARQLQLQLDEHNRDLLQALEEIRLLRGILPICCYCKNIRDDAGYWHQVELYLETHTDARFTHGICPECLGEHFPQFAARLQPELQQSPL